VVVVVVVVVRVVRENGKDKVLGVVGRYQRGRELQDVVDDWYVVQQWTEYFPSRRPQGGAAKGPARRFPHQKNVSVFRQVM